MNLQRLTQSWADFSSQRWTAHRQQLYELVGGRDARSRIEVIARVSNDDLIELLAIRGATCRDELTPLLSYAQHVVDDIDADARTHGDLAILHTCDLINALQSVGHRVPDRTVDIMARWSSDVQLTRAFEPVQYYWRLGFIALALDRRPVYYRIAGYNVDGAIRFTGPQAFQFNMQGLLGHLAGAIENQVPVRDVLTAWRDVLRSFYELWRADMLDVASLLWIARIIHHRIAKKPLVEVADFFRDSVADAVAAR